MWLLHHLSFSPLPLPLPLPRSPPLSNSYKRLYKLQSHCMERAPSPVREFPHLSHAHRQLMLGLLSTIDDRLGAQLLPSTVPPDVLSYANPAGTNRGAFDFRHGSENSSVDLILESWLHSEVPTGEVNIIAMYAFLNASTDAPHLILEFVQSSPSSLMFFMDLLPRKDLVLYPDYRNDYYQETSLDKQRQEIEKVPQVAPYCTSLYVRTIFSPTAISVRIDCGADGESSMEEIISGSVTDVAMEILGVWLDKCAGSSKQLEETERNVLIKRDNLLKSNAVETDLGESFPRLFGPEVADRVLGVIRKAYRI